MSIASETNRNNYIGNGAALTYSYTFKIFNDDELRVTVKSTLDVETTLTLNTHYTVTGAGSNSGGSISLVNGAFDWINSTFLKSGYALTIRRDLELIQETDIRNQGEFFPEIHEDVFDRLTMLDQQQQDELSRSVKLSETSVVADFDPTLPAGIVGEVNKVLMTNATGDGFEVGPSASAISSASADAAAAAASAAAALVSENAAAASASAASTSASNASTSATNAASSASSAAAAVSAHEADTTNIHGIADTSLLVTTTGTQVVTNKDIDGGTASNTSRITIPKAAKSTLDGLTRKEATLVYASDTDKMYYDDGSILKLVGSGSGGAVNFISDGDAEGSNIWTAYADAAGTRPVDGTGGSPTVTATISSTTPLSGTNSFLLTKGASNTQGEGIATAFSVDLAYRAKVLQIEFDYILSSGTFTAGSSSADSDVIVYIYDVTNSTLIEPSSIKLLSNSTTLGDKFVANFQSSATGSSYRLILHCATTSASAYTLKLDNFRVGPSNYVYGTPITDWVSYTPTFGAGFGTVTSISMYSRRVGDQLEMRGKFTLGTVAASAATFTMGYGGGNANVTFDSSKLPTGNVCGIHGSNQTASTTNFIYVPLAPASNGGTAIQFGQRSGTNVETTVVNGTAWNNSTILHVSCSVPVTGWSSSVQVSDSYDGRQIAASYSTATAQSIPSGASTIIDFTTKIYDTTASVTTGASWKFTAPSYGIYEFIVHAEYDSQAFTVDDKIALLLHKNGSEVRTLQYKEVQSTTTSYKELRGAGTIELNAGDYIDFRANQNSGTAKTLIANANYNYVSVHKLASGQAISATEVVAAGYSLSANKTPAANAAIDFDSKLYDTHNAVTTGGSGVWKFTAPYSGIYEVNMTGALTSGSQTVDLYKNGVQGKVLMSVTTSVASGSASVLLNAGDYISANPDGSVTFTSTKNTNIYIKRLK